MAYRNAVKLIFVDTTIPPPIPPEPGQPSICKVKIQIGDMWHKAGMKIQIGNEWRIIFGVKINIFNGITYEWRCVDSCHTMYVTWGEVLERTWGDLSTSTWKDVMEVREYK